LTLKTEFMALDKHLSRACSELQATEDDIQSLIHSTNDEELFGMLMELDTIVSRYNDIDEMRETIKKRLGIND
jgi:hypothetical protein